MTHTDGILSGRSYAITQQETGRTMASSHYSDAELLGEPTLDEMLADPIVQLVMKRDGVRLNDMRGELDRMQRLYAELPAAV